MGKQVIFIAGLYPKEFTDEIQQNAINFLDNAANALQWKYVQGILAQDETNLKVINAEYIGSYPKKYRSIKIPTRQFGKQYGFEGFDVGFSNLMYIKHISRALRLRKSLKRNTDNVDVIFAYAMTTTNIWLLKNIKRERPSVKTCLVVPDLPEYMNTTNRTSCLYKWRKALETRYINRNLKYIDHCTLLTKHMSEKLNISGKVTICDGMADEVEYVKKPFGNDGVCRVTYTGSLHERYGVMDLVSSMAYIKSDKVKLTVCGAGDSSAKIEKASEKDKRIEFLGLKSSDEIRNIQLNSDILISPRRNAEDFVKYSFPSKILEYMSMGRIVLTYRLSSFSEEYDEYLNYIEESSEPAQGIAQSIERIKSLSEDSRDAIGRKNYIFTQKSRLPTINIRRVLDDVYE